MSEWKDAAQRAFRRFAHRVDNEFDRLKLQVASRLGAIDPVQIVPYRGYGNAASVRVTGRVLENEGTGTPQQNDAWWENILAMYRRFETDEVPHAQLRARLDGQTLEAVTDDEGYFAFDFTLPRPLSGDRLWHEVELELIDEQILRRSGQQGPVRATGHAIVPPDSCRFGVISDIDDTVLVSHATSLVQMARLTFLHNARTRMPFEGVAAFYRALHAGAGGNERNPIYYVSSSPWNLYDLLVEFFNLNVIPAGPLLLRDLGIDESKFIKSGHDHKLDKIRDLLEMYPKLPFILIGDSGQEDPALYRQAVEIHRGRILAIYIRHVAQTDPKRVETLAQEAREFGVPMILAPDTAAAAAHAASQGYIAPQTLPGVERERQKDHEAVGN